MKILAIDTSTEACSAALLLGQQQLSQYQFAVRQHATLILPMIEALLKEANISITQLDAIAFGRGPGSFTGLRIAASVTQGLALPHDIPVIAISSLHTLAQMARHEFNATKVLSAIDARMQQVYWGEYHLKDEIMQAVGEELVINPEDIAVLKDNNYVGIGSGWASYATLLQSRFAENLSHIEGLRYPLAKDMLVLAELSLVQGKAMAAELAVPVYIRDKITQ